MLNIRNVDCMALMKELPDKWADLAIVDPPYGIGNWIDDKAYFKDGRKRASVPLGNKKVLWNETTPTPDYFTELYRVSRKQIIWGANYYNCFNNLGGAIIWYKGDGNPVYSFCEIASLSFQKKVDYVHINWQSGFYRASIEKIIHPCQKPVALYEWLLTKYAKKGDKILDTHLGSGSSAIACHNLGFDLTACDLDKDYYDAAMKRINFHQAQKRMF